MSRDVNFVINNCISCLKNKKFRPKDLLCLVWEWEVPMILKRAAEIKLLNEVALPRAIDNLLHTQVQHRKTQDKAHNVQIEILKVGSKSCFGTQK